MPKVTCAKCNSSGRIWTTFLFFRWRSDCKYCKGSGKIEMFDPPPKPAERPFGLRQVPPKPVTPSYVGRPTVPLDQPLSASTEGMLNTAAATHVLNGIANALLVPVVPAESGVQQSDKPAADFTSASPMDTGQQGQVCDSGQTP